MSELQKFKLDWSVRTEGLQTDSGIEVKESIAIVREDTNKILSVRGKDYQIYQNEEMLEILQKISGSSGLEIKKGGYFGHGEKVYIQLKSADLILGKDKVEGFITGVNSFDGTTSLAFGNTNVTISCLNTFFGAFRSLQSKVRHTKNMGLKIDEILNGIDKMLIDEKVQFEKIVKLSETRIPQGDLSDDFISTLLGLPLSKIKDPDLSGKTKGNVDRIREAIDHQIKDKGDNLWGLFSGITKYTTHDLKTKKDSSELKMFGVYGNRERQIFKELEAYV